jgi:hypothetical protein
LLFLVGRPHMNGARMAFIYAIEVEIVLLALVYVLLG